MYYFLLTHNGSKSLFNNKIANFLVWSSKILQIDIRPMGQYTNALWDLQQCIGVLGPKCLRTIVWEKFALRPKWTCTFMLALFITARSGSKANIHCDMFPQDNTSKQWEWTHHSNMHERGQSQKSNSWIKECRILDGCYHIYKYQRKAKLNYVDESTEKIKGNLRVWDNRTRWGQGSRRAHKHGHWF